jgi:hypothetical protein
MSGPLPKRTETFLGGNMMRDKGVWHEDFPMGKHAKRPWNGVKWTFIQVT